MESAHNSLAHAILNKVLEDGAEGCFRPLKPVT